MPSPTATVQTPRGLAVFVEGKGFMVPGAEYHHVNLGPKDGQPEWTQHAFPSERPTLAFAKAHKRLEPDRAVSIDYPNGRRWDGERWLDTPGMERVA